MFVMMWECVSCRLFFIEFLDECCTIHTRINHLKSSCLFAIGMHMLSLPHVCRLFKGTIHVIWITRQITSDIL